MYITFRQAIEADACDEGIRRMRDHLGASCPDDLPVPIATVLAVSGLEDALWALDAIGEHRTLRLFAADCAERVVDLTFPQPAAAQAIRVARLYARGLAGDTELDAARYATWDAARAAASDDAWAAAQYATQYAARAAALYAARYAARDAERAWQVARLRAYLTGMA